MNAVQETLRRFGVTRCYKGFEYVTYALDLVLDKDSCLTAMTQDVYVPIAEHFGVNWMAAERNIRTITARVPWIVWEEDGQILGYAYGSPLFSRAAYSWCAEPSVYLCPEARGRGIGRKLYNALEEILKMQGYQVLYALITEENKASLAFHEKLGYRARVLFPDCGFKFGRWLGITWLQKQLNSLDTPTSMPRPWTEFVKTDRNLGEILDLFCTVSRVKTRMNG